MSVAVGVSLLPLLGVEYRTDGLGRHSPRAEQTRDAGDQGVVSHLFDYQALHYGAT